MGEVPLGNFLDPIAKVWGNSPQALSTSSIAAKKHCHKFKVEKKSMKKRVTK